MLLVTRMLCLGRAPSGFPSASLLTRALCLGRAPSGLPSASLLEQKQPNHLPWLLSEFPVAGPPIAPPNHRVHCLMPRRARVPLPGQGSLCLTKRPSACARVSLPVQGSPCSPLGNGTLSLFFFFSLPAMSASRPSGLHGALLQPLASQHAPILHPQFWIYHGDRARPGR